MMNAMSDITAQIANQASERGRRRNNCTQTRTQTDLKNIEKYWENPKCPFKYCWSHGSCKHDGEHCR